jgi:dihydrofolate reductase
MLAPYRTIGYAIVSSDGMIADAGGIMPDSLKIEADQQNFARALDSVDAVVHGRHSHEGQPTSPRRRRLVATRKVAAIAHDPDHPNSLLWNPVGASFDEACRALGLATGTVAVLGGTGVFDMFLDTGYDAFHLSRAGKVKLPGGTPVFSQVRFGRSPEDVLTQFGLEPGPIRVLDEVNAVSLVSWTRKTRA